MVDHAAMRVCRPLLDPVTSDSFPGRSLRSGPFVFSSFVTAARTLGRGNAVRLGAA
jgi:hypothetical protein